MKPIMYKKSNTWSVEIKNDITGEIYEGEYIDMRIQMDSIPSGKHGYNCRHDDDGDWVTPVTIEKGGVMINFAGVFITETEIAFPEGQDYIPVTMLD